MIAPLLLTLALATQAPAAKAPTPKAPAPKAATPAPKAAATPAVPAAPAGPTLQEICSAWTATGAQGTPFPALKLLNQAPNASLPQLPIAGANAVRCERNALIIGDQDYRVVTEYGAPLIVAAGGRVGALELQDGAFRFRMITGELTGAETAWVLQTINAAATAANSRAAR
jgi:hypothetical protein